jgi:hypothetical protein
MVAQRDELTDAIDDLRKAMATAAELLKTREIRRDAAE